MKLTPNELLSLEEFAWAQGYAAAKDGMSLPGRDVDPECASDAPEEPPPLIATADVLSLPKIMVRLGFSLRDPISGRTSEVIVDVPLGGLELVPKGAQSFSVQEVRR